MESNVSSEVMGQELFDLSLKVDDYHFEIDYINILFNLIFFVKFLLN